MNSTRHGEQGHYPFRSERVCCENGRWYFNTREGTLMGPYHDQVEAKKALAVFVAEKIQESGIQHIDADDGLIDAPTDIQHMVEELLGFFRSRSESGLMAALAWAHTRIDDLRSSRDATSSQKERIDILYYAMDQDPRFSYR